MILICVKLYNYVIYKNVIINVYSDIEFISHTENIHVYYTESDNSIAPLLHELCTSKYLFNDW